MSDVSKPTDWRRRLDLRLEDFVDEFVVDGAAHDEVFDAISARVSALRKALDRDPDPAEESKSGDSLSEPANDLPAAKA